MTRITLVPSGIVKEVGVWLVGLVQGQGHYTGGSGFSKPGLLLQGFVCEPYQSCSPFAVCR